MLSSTRAVFIVVLLLLLVACATATGGRPKWIDKPNEDLLEESKTARFAVGMVEGYSEGDLRLAAAAMARHELANYVNVRIEGSVKSALAEQQNLVNPGEDVSEVVLKSVTEQSTGMVLALTTVENYFAEKLEGGKLKVYARVKLDLPSTIERLKTMLTASVQNGEPGKKLFLEDKAAEGLTAIHKALDKQFETKK